MGFGEAVRNFLSRKKPETIAAPTTSAAFQVPEAPPTSASPESVAAGLPTPIGGAAPDANADISAGMAAQINNPGVGVKAPTPGISEQSTPTSAAEKPAA